MFEQIGDAIGIVAGAEARHGIGLDGLVAAEIGRLFEIADGRRGVAKNLAALRFGKACRNLHQGRFARAVAADKADAVTGLDLQVRAGQQRRAAEA